MGCSPRVGIREERGAGCSAAWTGGGGEHGSRPRSRKGRAGLLDASGRRGVLLRRQRRGQRGQRCGGGEELRGGGVYRWRRRVAPVSNPRAERGVEGVGGSCRRTPPPCGAPAWRRGRS